MLSILRMLQAEPVSGLDLHRDLIRKCSAKNKLYMGHCVKLSSKRDEIDTIKSNLTIEQRFLFMVFKVKFESMYIAENITSFYGKGFIMT